MNKKHYRVTCLNCNKSNVAIISEIRKDEFSVDLNKDHHRNPDNVNIISGRYRKDMDFGWECRCGNTSIVARSEFPDIEKLVINGGEATITKITNSLKIEDKKKFKVTPL